MADSPECCPNCGRFSSLGLQQYHARHRSIYGVDFTKPNSDLVEDVRNQLTKARGQLWDIGFRYTGWADRLKSIEGLLTCGLVSLHYVKEEMKESEQKFPPEAVLAAVGGAQT